MRKIIQIYFYIWSAFAIISPAHAISTMPTSGTCAFLVTFPVPYGLANVTSYGETGYNLMGTITFTSATTATFNLVAENAIYKTNGSPVLGPSVTVKNAPATIAPMTDANGFLGGSKITIAITAKKETQTMTDTVIWNAVATNAGKTILLQGSRLTNGLGEPASGVCQF